MALGRHTCVDCKTQSPETELSYSLSLGFAGWRLVKVQKPSGEVQEWRCPKCWQVYKRKTMARTQTNLPTLDAIETKKKPQR